MRDIERLIRMTIPASDRAAPASRLEAGTKPKIGRSPAGRPGKRQQPRQASAARKTGHKSRQHGGRERDGVLDRIGRVHAPSFIGTRCCLSAPERIAYLKGP